MFKINVSTYSSVTMYSRHTKEADDIFVGDTSVVGTVVSDPTFLKPDLTRYYFSNMGAGITAVDRNNAVMMVKVKEFGANFMGHMKHKLNMEENRGIFIVDYVRNYDSHGNNINTLYNFYNTDNSNLDPEILRQVRGMTSKELLNNISSGICEIRFVHFIPASKLDERGYLYDSTCDTLFCKYGVDKTVIHPFSKNVLTKVEAESYVPTEPNRVVIDIIDNLSSRAYYINIAGIVYSIYSKCDKTRQDGIYFRTNISHSPEKDVYIEFKDSSEHGIYLNRDEAIANTSVDKVIELKKLTNAYKELENKDKDLEFKYKDLEFKHSELEYKHNELGIKNEELLNKLEALRLELDLTRKKKELETTRINYDIVKTNTEIKMLSIKTKMELNKIQYDLCRDMSSIQKEILKHKMELIILNNKMETESANSLYKLSDFLLKGATILINQFK